MNLTTSGYGNNRLYSDVKDIANRASYSGVFQIYDSSGLGTTIDATGLSAKTLAGKSTQNKVKPGLQLPQKLKPFLPQVLLLTFK